MCFLVLQPPEREREKKKTNKHAHKQKSISLSLSLFSLRRGTITEMRRCIINSGVKTMRFLAFLLICSCFSLAFSAELEDIGTDSVVTREINGTSVVESNATNAKPKEDSFADMIDRALEKEFPENDQNEGSSFSLDLQSFYISFHFAIWVFLVSPYRARVFVFRDSSH